MHKNVTLKMTYEKPSQPDLGGEAYIYLAETISPAEAKKQVQVPAISTDGMQRGTLILDFDKDGRLLGIEALSAAFILPPSLIAHFSDES